MKARSRRFKTSVPLLLGTLAVLTMGADGERRIVQIRGTKWMLGQDSAGARSLTLEADQDVVGRSRITRPTLIVSCGDPRILATLVLPIDALPDKGKRTATVDVQLDEETHFTAPALLKGSGHTLELAASVADRLPRQQRLRLKVPVSVGNVESTFDLTGLGGAVVYLRCEASGPKEF